MVTSLLRIGIALTYGLAWFPTYAYEGGRREQVDGGIHQPQLTKAPALLKFVEAEFPKEALEAGAADSVTLTVTIDITGTVSDARVKTPTGHGFDAAALKAVRQFVFSPAEVDGLPASIQIEYVYHFVKKAPSDAVAAGPPTASPLAHLRGRLVARGSRNRVPAATVRCGNQPDAPEAVSNEKGQFDLKTSPGLCAVHVTANNFEPFSALETLASDETLEIVYYLLPKSIGFETVVRGDKDKKEVVRRTLTRQELQKVPGSFGDPLRVLQDLPGVARSPFDIGQLVIRGAEPYQSLTFLDGIEIPLVYHFLGGPSVVNSEFLDHIDFYPGGFGAHYGRAIGGVVDVTTRKAKPDTWHGSAKVDFIDASLFLQAPLSEGVSVAAAVRRSYIDAFIPLFLPKASGGGTLQILPRYWDYQVKLDGAPKLDSSGATQSYGVMAFGSDDVLTVVATGGGRNRDVNLGTHTLFHRVKADWTYRKGNFSSVFTPYLGYDLNSLTLGTSFFNADTYTLAARQDFALEISRRWKIRAGADIFFQHNLGHAQFPAQADVQYPSFPGASPQAEPVKVDIPVNSFDGAAYLESDFQVGKLTVTPGLRGSYARIAGQDRGAADPRLWLRYPLSPRTVVKGSLGLYTQPPAALDMLPVPYGYPALIHEKAFQSSLGVEQKISDVVHFDVTGFFNRRYDNIISPGLYPGGGAPRNLYANIGLGRSYGVEVLLKHEVTKRFFCWLAYTLSRSETRASNSGQPYTPFRYDETYILAVIGSYRIGGGWEIGARFRYVTGRPVTPLTHPFDRYDADSNNFSGSYGPDNSSRLKAFEQLDLRLDKSFLFQSVTLNIYLDVQNVYNRQNVEFTLHDYRYRQSTSIPGIPFLPNLGVKVTF